MQIPSVSAIIRDENDRVLMVKNDNVGVCGLPAGAIDLGESPSEAVVREVFEETGLQVKPVQIAGVFGGGNFRYIYPNGDAVEYFIVVFECEITGGELSARDGEVSKFRYFSIEDMPVLAIPYPQSIFSGNFTESQFQ